MKKQQIRQLDVTQKLTTGVTKKISTEPSARETTNTTASGWLVGWLVGLLGWLVSEYTDLETPPSAIPEPDRTPSRNVAWLAGVTQAGG